LIQERKIGTDEIIELEVRDKTQGEVEYKNQQKQERKAFCRRRKTDRQRRSVRKEQRQMKTGRET
jgi:hypothetical protein